MTDAGSATATSAFTMTVNAVNDAPQFSIGGNPAASAEDAGLQTVAGFATGMAVGPATAVAFDEGGQTLTFTANITGTIGGLTFSSAPAVNAGTGNLTYQAAANSSGTATINLSLADNGGTANGGVNTSGVQTFTITVNAVNDPPVNAVPGAQTTNESTAKVFSAANSNAISVTDAGSADLVTTVTVTSGTLTAGAAGTAPPLTSITGNGTATLVLTGTAAEITAALDGLTFTPVTGSSTPVTLTVTTNDQGNTGGPAEQDQGTVAITITAVNDPPVNTVPGAQTTPGNTPLVFSTGNSNAISFADVDAGAATNITVTVSVTAGTGLLSAGPSGTAPPLTTVTGNNTATLQLTGSVTTLNSALQGLTFTPQTNVTGTTTLTVLTDDAGNTGPPGVQQDVDTVQIAVGALPTVSINDPSAVTEGDTGTPNSIQFTVTLSAASNLTVTVQHTTVNLTATGGVACTAGVDYITTDGTLTFVPTDTSETITVPICGDFAIEGNETFRVDLGTPVNATINDGQGTGAITDDDAAGTIAFTAATAKVNETGGSVTLTVQRTGGNAGGITVQFGTGDVTAEAGSDFTLTTGTLTFGANETTKTIAVPDSQDETFTVTLANPQGGATLGSPSVLTVTIVASIQAQGGEPLQDDTDPSRKNTRES